MRVRPSVATSCLVLLAAGAVLAGCGGSDATHSAPAYQHFATRPDLKPPVFRVHTSRAPAGEGYVFLGVKMGAPQPAPLIVDTHGNLVWMDPSAGTVDDVRVQQYDGQPVLTYWTGKGKAGYGYGSYVLLDSHYHRIATVHAVGLRGGDLHEFTLTPNGTALITAYREVPYDLSSIGGPKNGYLLDGVAQEIDVATGKLVFQWDALNDIKLSETYAKLGKNGNGTKAKPFDYFHINSVDSDGAGHLLISARNTHGIYQVSERTGHLDWRLGGKDSDFTMGPGTRFAWQHDARYRTGNTISLYDDEAKAEPEPYARGLFLHLDPATMTATVARQYLSPDKLIVDSQGNVQVLPSGNVFIGWGSEPYVTEFGPSGTVLFDMSFTAGADSYRAYRFPWVGSPTTLPDVAAKAHGPDRMIVSMSWNGATQVASWQILAGPSPDDLSQVGTATRSGFETTARVARDSYVAARALDASGQVLATSKVRRVRG